MLRNPLVRLRTICLALPEVHEVQSHGEPTFRVKNKMFATFANADNRHGRGRHGVWIKAAPGRQARAVKTDPDRFFVPPTSGRVDGSAYTSMRKRTGKSSRTSCVPRTRSWRRRS